MHRLHRVTAGAALIAIIATGCSNADARPVLDLRRSPAGGRRRRSRGRGRPARGGGGVGGRQDCHRGIRPRVYPHRRHVPAAGTYDVSFHNTGATLHDVTFADGTRLSAAGGETATGTVTVPEGGLAFTCSIPGHADAGMKGRSRSRGMRRWPACRRPAAARPSSSSHRRWRAAAPAADPAAAKHERFDPVAPALLPGTVHDIDLPMIEKDMTVADGFVVHAWTFGGTVPGPDHPRPPRRHGQRASHQQGAR